MSGASRGTCAQRSGEEQRGAIPAGELRPRGGLPRQSTTIDRRGGDGRRLEPLGIAAADQFLADAIGAAERDAGISWHGQVFAVDGNPDVISSAENSADEE